MKTTKSKFLTLTLAVMMLSLTACRSDDDLTGRTIGIFKIEGANATMTKGDDKPFDAKAGMRLGANYTTQTGGNTYAYLVIGEDSLVKMDENTEISVDQISERALKLNLLNGEILINEKQKSGDFEIQAGNTTLGIRGTFFTASYKDSAFTVDLIEGQVDVITDRDTTRVTQGNRITVINSAVTIEKIDEAKFSNFTRNAIQEFQNDLVGTIPTESDTFAVDMPDGYGVWEWPPFRYEGEWKDGKPNGQGTLYETVSPPENKQAGYTYPVEIILQGNFSDGLAHGTTTMIWFMEHGETHTWTFTADMGYTNVGQVFSSTSDADYTFEPGELFGVPPWIDEEPPEADEHGTITTSGMILNNMDTYGAQYNAFSAEYGIGQVGIATFGIRFENPVIMPNGEAVSEATLTFDRSREEEIFGTWLENISADGMIVYNESMIGSNITMSGYLEIDESYAEFSAVTDGRFTVPYFYAPNGGYTFTVISTIN
jgi:hypothetical protein